MDHFKFIENLNQNVCETWQNAILMWENRNKATYSFIQQYAEKLIILIFVNMGKKQNLGQTPNLGKLLDNKYVRVSLNIDFGLKDVDFSVLSEINKSGNMAKHGLGDITFIEDKVSKYFEFCYVLSKHYAETLGVKNIQPFDLSLLNRKNEIVFVNEVKDSVVTKTSTIIEELDEKVASISLKNGILEEANHNLKLDNTVNKNYDSNFELLKSKYVEALSNYDKYTALLAQMPDDNFLEEKVNEFYETVEDIEKEINSIKQNSQKNKDVLIYNNLLNIDSNSRVLGEILKTKEILTGINKGSNERPYYEYSALLKHLNVSFESCYIESNQFSVKGIKDSNSSVSFYKSYYAVVYNQLIRGKQIALPGYLSSMELSDQDYVDIYKVQIVLLALIKNGELGDDYWSINFTNIKSSTVEYAVSDIIQRVSDLIVLANRDFAIPIRQFSYLALQTGMINISFDVIYPTEMKSFTVLTDYQEDNLTHLWIEDLIPYKMEYSNPSHVGILGKLVKELFSFDNFLEGQLGILINVLNNKNTIGILTTGGGKSLIYQFAGLMQPKLTIIVDPINALINDQYRKLTEEFSINSAIRVIKHKIENQTISAKGALDLLIKRPPLFIFTSPERFQNQDFRDWLIEQSINKQIGLIVLDEVHCLSEWGHDFRVSYLMLTHTINTYCSNFQYLGLTATAAINVIKDLQVELGIFDKNNVIFSRKLQRDNLDFNIIKFKHYDQMKNALSEMIESDYNDPKYDFHLKTDNPNAIIVFFKIKPQLKTLYEEFQLKYKDELTLFSGDIKDTQDDFMYNRKTLLFSTNAFGMGIDKPNVRKTVHFGMPASKEAYFQEAGRAGRDGKNSSCLLMTFDTDDINKIRINKFLNLSTTVEELLRLQSDFGKNEKNDLSVLAYFLTKDLDTPENEAKTCVNLYRYIDNHQKNNETKLTLESMKDQNRLNRLQNNLYILHKLGSVRTWTVKYIPLMNNDNDISIELTVSLHPEYKNFDFLRRNVVNYLAQYLPNQKIISDIEDLSGTDKLEEMITKMREWYQSTFIRSRREQLANMVDFVERYKNSQRNMDIQNEMSQFFDITRLLERRESMNSLTFTNVNISTIVKRSVKNSIEEIKDLRITMERLLETEESNKINIFTSLVNFRLGDFESRNGRDRLTLALDQSSDSEIVEFYESSKHLYSSSSDDNKKVLLDFLHSYNENVFFNHAFGNEIMDDIIAPYYVSSINHFYSDQI